MAQQTNNKAQQANDYSGQWTGTWTANSPHENPTPKDQRSDSNQNASRLRQVWEWIGRITAQDVFNCIIAVATVFIARFNWKLVRVTHDLHEASQKAEEPSLNVDGGNLTATKKDGLDNDLATAFGFDPDRYKEIVDTTISFTIQNPGKGIAKIERTRARPRVVHRPLSPFSNTTDLKFRTIDVRVANRTIAANSRALAFVFVQAIPANEWAIIETGIGGRFGIFCTISYRDVFDKKYEERFWLMYEPQSTDFRTKKVTPAVVWIDSSRRDMRLPKQAKRTKPKKRFYTGLIFWRPRNAA